MQYRWAIPTSIEAYHTRPASRHQMASAGGFFPILVSLPDGRLAGVVREGDFHVGQRGWLGFLTSDDGGESWSEPKRIAFGPQDPCHIAFGCTQAGTLLVSYVLPHAYPNGSWDKSVMPAGPTYLVRSEDLGQTWSAPAAMDTSAIPVECISPYGRLVQMPDGALLMDFYAAVPKEGGKMAWDSPLERTYASYILRSRDDGLTWGDASLIAREGLNEAALLYLPSGKLLAALRHHDPLDGGDVFLAESMDEGYTWSPAERITDHYQHPADLLRLADGRVLLTFGHRQMPMGVRGLISRDEGKTWDREHALILASESLSSDCGYPSAVQLPDGNVVVAYYALQSPGPFVHKNEIAGPYAATIKFHASVLP